MFSFVSGLKVMISSRRLRNSGRKERFRSASTFAFDPIYGARPLKRYLQSHVETLLARKMIAEDIAPDTEITVDVKDGELFAETSSEKKTK